mmetsp:Transcript_56461/g.131562  ORF Transcript_56461/g.131562 Transcript_56461/m.131562 type:complete len:200 (+) Transcript_56461:974-1573(+)
MRPESHALVQGENGDQSPSAQSTSQEPVLQGWESSVLEHGWPPCLGCSSMVRVRMRRPPPHSLLHFDHWLQSVSLQFTGHFTWLHLRVVSSAGHGVPQRLFLVMISRCSVRFPPTRLSSHGIVHSLGTQSPTLQSTSCSAVRPGMWASNSALRTRTAPHICSFTIRWTVSLHSSFVFCFNLSSRVVSCCFIVCSSSSES